MSEQKEIPKSCFTCKKSVNCYSNYGGGTCKYKFAIEEMERNSSTQTRKEVGPHAG